MAKDNYNSRAYNFLVKSGYIDPQEVNFNSFNAKMSNPDFSRSVYLNFQDAQKKGKIGTLKPYEEFVSEFGVATPVTQNQVADSGNMVAPQKTFPTPEQINTPVAPSQPLPNVGIPAPGMAEAPEVTPTGLPTIESLGQGVQPIPGTDPLANAPQQQFQWSGQQPTQPVVQPQVKQVGELNPQDASSQGGYMDFLSNAIQRGYNRGEIADYITAMSKEPTGEEIRKIAELTRENDKLSTSEYMQKFAENPDLTSTLQSLPEIALESIASLYRHGLSRMATGAGTGAVVGSVVPGAGTLAGAGTGALAGMTVAGLGMEVSSTIMDSLNELGIDTGSEDALKQAFSNPDIMKYVRQKAYARGIPIATIDAVSMGVAGKLLGKPVSSAVSRGLQVMGEAGIQGTLGATGEATAQMVSGEDFKPYEILAEGLAEIPGSIPEVGIAVLGKNKSTGKDTKLESARLAVNNPDLSPESISEIIDVGVGSGEINSQQAEELKQEITKAKEINATIPEDIKDPELRATAIGLIEERDVLTTQLEAVDEAFKPKIQEKIKAINEQLLGMAQPKDSVSETKTEEIATTEPVVATEVVSETVSEPVVTEEAVVSEPVAEVTTETEQVQPEAITTTETEIPALADVESTAKALEGVDVEGEILSKTNVVDDSNKPLRLYHGTNADFDDFEVTKSSRIVLMNPHDVETKAFFFHPDVEFAKSFGSKIKEVKLNVKKLANNHLSDLIASIKETWGSAGSVETANNGNIYFEDYEGDSWINKMADKDGIDWMLLESPEFIKNLENRGIDGTGVWEDDNSISYAVFNAKNIIQKKDPKQLSSAYHKAKQDGSNPELVQAVEQLLKPESKSPTTETVATTTETLEQEAGQVVSETEIKPITPVNTTDVETITKIENAPEKGRELALNKPTNKHLKRAFEAYEDIVARARKAGIYDGKTLKIGGQEVEVDTPAKFKAFLSNQGNFDAVSDAVKDVKAEIKEQHIPEPTPKQVVDNAKTVFDDAKSTFVWPIGLNPKFKFDSRLPQKVKNLFNKYFRPRGLWTPELFKGKRMNEARMASQMERVKFKVRDLNNAINEAYPKGVKTADVQRMNDFLQGNTVELPPALYRPLEAMREHIDELSRQMVEAGIIDDKLKPVFDRNMGVYTTRTYQIHNDPKAWIDYITNTPEGQELRNKAVNQLRQAEQGKAERMNELADKAEEQGSNLMRMAELSETSDPERARKFEARAEALFMKAERLRQQSEVLLQQDFDAQIDAFLFAESMPLDVVSKGNVGSKDLGILKKRKDIDAVMRDLMGEEKDPLTNYVMSVAKMSALISNNQFLNEAKTQGLRDGTFTQEPKGKNIVQIASESSDTMNPLNGLYTTPEIADAFKNYNEIVKEQWYIDLILRLNGAVKLGKTLLSPQTHVRNFGSNFIIELANGALDLSKGKEARLSQFETIFGLPEGESKTKYREYIERLTKLGVLDQGGNYRDMLSFYNDLKVGKFDYQKVIEPKITKLGKATMGKIKEFYKAEDDFWKVYAFENERAVLKEAYPDKTDAELDAMAADKVLRTRVNYAMAPKIIQTIKRNPAFGTFPTFPAEMLRIGYNIPAVAVEEMKSGNAVMQKQGAKRMAMYMAALTLPLAANQFSSWWLDMDDEEEEARKKFLAPWAQNSTLIWLKGKDRYIDTGYSDAFNVLKKPAVAAFRGKDMLDGGMDAVLQFIEPFISEEIGYKTISEIKNNRDEYDKSIYNENADWQTQLGQILAYAGKKFEPGFISQGRRIYKGEKGELSEKGQKYNTGDEIINTVLGQKVTTVDWDNAIMFKMKAEVEDIKDSNSFYNKKNRELPKSDKQGRKTEAEITNLAVKQNYDNLREYYEAAKKIGYTTLKIGTIMRESGVPAEMIAGVLTNKPYSNYLVITKDGEVLDRETQRRLK